MKTILINLNSIKDNPNYKTSGTIERIPGRQQITFTSNKLPSLLIEGENCVISQWRQEGDIKYDIEGILLYPLTLQQLKEIEKECKEKEIKFTLSKQIDFIDVTTVFEPPLYLFKYIHELVRCKECGVIFSSQDFKYYSSEGRFCCGDGHASTSTGCPKCETYDCVDIKFEDINEALIRKENKL